MIHVHRWILKQTKLLELEMKRRNFVFRVSEKAENYEIKWIKKKKGVK